MKRKAVSIITALALCLSLCPAWMLAAEGDTGLCPHHSEHTAECGYRAPTAGHPCGHRHAAECYALGVIPDGDRDEYYRLGGEGGNALVCRHVHDGACGYVRADPGRPCGYDCKLCRIGDLLDRLPDQVTEENADTVRTQLGEILGLYRELGEEDQGQIDPSRCQELQAELDALAGRPGANAPEMIAGDSAEIDTRYIDQGFIFAQGVPIVIKQNGSITSIYSIDDTDGVPLSGEADVSSFLIYGGWFDGSAIHTGSPSIVMESGTAGYIYGGSLQGTLDGSTSVTIRGGSVNAVYGGGNQSTVTGNTDIVLDGGTVGWVYGGGYCSTVTGTARVTVDQGAKVWGNKRTDPNVESRGTVFGGGCGGTVSNTEVVFNGGDAGWVYGGGACAYAQDGTLIAACACTNTRVRFMGQPDDYMSVSAGGNGGSVQKAVLEFHGNGSSLNSKGIYVYGGGWGDAVEEVQIVVGENSTPSTVVFCAQWTGSGSTVGAASFEVHLSAADPSMMNSSGLDGTGVTGTVTATIFGDASTDAIFSAALTEIDELIVSSGTFELSDPMELDRLEVKDSGVAILQAVGGTTKLGTLAGSGTVLFAKRREAATTLPVTVDRIEVPEGSRIKLGSIGGYLSPAWADTVVFQGVGVEALSSASCFSSRDVGYYLAKTDDGRGIQVKEGTEQKPTSIDPVPTFDKPSYQYGETMHITMGLKSEGAPVSGQLLEVRGGVSGLQTFASAVTGEDGRASFDLPVDDDLWASRETGLQAMFHATEGYKESFYGISLENGTGAMAYIVTGARAALESEIAAPVRGEVPVKALSMGADAICTAEVLWSPSDAEFRPEVAYTASVRLIPRQGYRLDGGRLDSVTYQGKSLTLPGVTEADGSMVIPNVATFAPLSTIHVAGVTLDQSFLSLRVGGTARLTAAIAPSDAENKTVSWASSDPAVAAVDDDGNVTAVTAGTATITVTTADRGKTASCTVTVTPPSVPVTTVTVNKTSLTLTVGGTERLTAAVAPGDATDKTVAWASSDPAVATVDGDGNVTAVAAGTATITATTTDGGRTASCAVTVTAPSVPVTTVTMDKTSLTLTVGGTERLTAAVAPGDATDKTVTWASSNTAVATVDDNGNVTAVAAGTATITVTTADGGRTASCTVTVRAGGGNSGGSGGGSGGSGGGSSVTVPMSGGQSTVRVSAGVSGSTATVSRIDTTQIDRAIGDEGRAGMVEIDFTGLGRAIDTVELPAAAVKDLASKAEKEEIGGLTVKLTDSEIAFDARALSAIGAQAGGQIALTVAPAKPADLNDRQREAAGGAPVFDLTLRSGRGAITDFRGGHATMSLPYALTAGQDPGRVVVYYLDDAGHVTPCPTRYDAGRKSAIFTTGHLSLYFVGYDRAAEWADPFSDVAGDAWYYDAVRFVDENGLMGGYGNGLFGPNDGLTRAQFAQILFNREGRPVVNYLLRYGDVADGAWYTEAVRWAASQGVVGGYRNGTFGPNDRITRQQLAVMLWRYAGCPAATGKELHFTDADRIGGYALEAMRWAVESGVMGGYSDGRLEPQGLATRAQAAQMLMNFSKNR